MNIGFTMVIVLAQPESEGCTRIVHTMQVQTQLQTNEYMWWTLSSEDAVVGMIQ